MALSVKSLTHRFAVPPLPEGEGCHLYYFFTAHPEKKLLPRAVFSPLPVGERVAEGRVRAKPAFRSLVIAARISITNTTAPSLSANKPARKRAG